MSRAHPYEDPLDAIWLDCAAKTGLRVERSTDTYASTDGRGSLLLGDHESLDSDDCLAQMVLHELCHSLVCGRESFQWVDWGLDNETGRDIALEHATLRLQAALLEPLGLRQVLAPTTEYRTFYDDLPDDPFSEREKSERPSIVRARAGYARRVERPWAPHLEAALRTTVEILALVGRYRSEGRRDLLAQLGPATQLHRTGLPLHRAATQTEKAGEGPVCGNCGWFAPQTRGRARCMQSQGARVAQDDPACAHFEKELDCLACGACCREAYDSVDVSARDPVVLLAPSSLVKRGRRYELPRIGRRCAELEGGAALAIHRPAIAGPCGEIEQISPPFYAPNEVPFTCAIYQARPKTCHDFTRGSAHCLSARRRVGLSR